MSKPLKFWVVITTGKYPGAVYVHWASYSKDEVLEWAATDTKIPMGNLRAVKVHEVKRKRKVR